MENLSLSSIWRDGVYQDSSHFICFNREGQEEINLRLPKRAFPNTSGGNFRIQERHCNSISETRIWHSILRFSFLFSSLPTSPLPPPAPMIMTVTLYIGIISSFQIPTTYIPLSPRGVCGQEEGVPIHAYLGQRNELNNYVSSTTGLLNISYWLSYNNASFSLNPFRIL